MWKFEFVAPLILFFNCQMILTLPKNFEFFGHFCHLSCVEYGCSFTRIWISISINTYDFNSAYNWTNMNVWLRWGQMKLHRHYVNSLHIVVISHWSNWLSCNDRCTLAKVCGLVWLKCRCLVWLACLEPCMNKPRICCWAWLHK